MELGGKHTKDACDNDENMCLLFCFGHTDMVLYGLVGNIETNTRWHPLNDLGTNMLEFGFEYLRNTGLLEQIIRVKSRCTN